jgi:hypothetical protein
MPDSDTEHEPQTKANLLPGNLPADSTADSPKPDRGPDRADQDKTIIADQTEPEAAETRQQTVRQCWPLRFFPHPTSTTW